MKHWLKTAFGLIALGAAFPAAGEPSVLYGRIDGGGSFAQALSGDYADSTGLGGKRSSSGVVNIGMGASLPIPLVPIRSELDFSYRPQFALKSDGAVQANSTFRNLTAMLNLIMDIPVPLLIKPFAGIGAGVASNSLGTVDSTSNGVLLASERGNTITEFAWNAIAGLAFSIAPGVAVDLTYRYVDSGDLKSSGIDGSGRALKAVGSRLTTNEGMIGVRIGF